MKKQPTSQQAFSIDDPLNKLPGHLRDISIKDLVSPKQRKILQGETKKVVTKLSPLSHRIYRRAGKYPGITEALTTLRQGNPEPFFKLLEIIPDLLLEEEFWELSIKKWASRKVHDHQARHCLMRVGPALATIGQGRLRQRTPAQEARQNRQRQQRSRERDGRAETKLRRALEAALNNVRQRRDLRGQDFRAANRSAIERVLAAALQDPDSHVRKVAAKVQKKRRLRHAQA